MEVLINNRQKRIKFNHPRLRRIVQEVMKFEGCPENTELSLVFCDDDFIQKLNQDHRGRNEPTDVLSFPMDEETFESEVHLLGDIVVSIETAERQAQKLKHSVVLEVVFLLVHGLLHLRGYVHDSKMERHRMREREETICRLLCERNLLEDLDDDHAPLIKRAHGDEEN